jgi:hypothetical protein
LYSFPKRCGGCFPRQSLSPNASRRNAHLKALWVGRIALLIADAVTHAVIVNATSILDLASEFFYEFRRFIPGLALVAFYFKDQAENALLKHLVLSAIGILVVAWVFGLVIDTVMSLVVHCFYVGVCWLHEITGRPGLTEWLLKVIEPFDSDIDKLKKGGLPTYLEKRRIPEVLRIQVARAGALEFAERIVSRSLCCVFVIVTALPPESFLGVPWDWWYGPVGAVVFVFCWVWPCVIRRWVKEKVNEEVEDRWEGEEKAVKGGWIGLIILAVLVLGFFVVAGWEVCCCVVAVLAGSGAAVLWARETRESVKSFLEFFL